MRGLTGQVAIVTGAARRRGIGRAVALRLASEGCRVAVLAPPRDPATFPPGEREAGWMGAPSVCDEIAGSGGAAIPLECDITTPEHVDGAVDAVLAEYGRIDVLVNNAGITSDANVGSLLDLDPARWSQMVDVNLTGTFMMSRAAVGAMRRNEPRDAGGRGAVVNVSSTAGRRGMANSGAYSTTKFGVIGFTQQLALELASTGIRVNCICPGATPTDMTAAYWSSVADLAGIDVAAAIDATTGRIPMRRLATVDEQAAAIAFLVSDDASYITGQTLNVDGGLHLA